MPENKKTCLKIKIKMHAQKKKRLFKMTYIDKSVRPFGKDILGCVECDTCTFQLPMVCEFDVDE